MFEKNRGEWDYIDYRMMLPDKIKTSFLLVGGKGCIHRFLLSRINTRKRTSMVSILVSDDSH